MRVGEQRSVQRMILVAEKGRLASIATLGHMIRPAANDEASVPGHGRNPAQFRAGGKPTCNVQPHKMPTVRRAVRRDYMV